MARAADLIAETGDRFADFAPYVSSINDDGVVAFQAETAGGATAVFTGDGGSAREVDGGAGAAAISHPDINASGTSCFYAGLTGGGQGVIVVSGGVSRTVVDTASGFHAIGPLGPTMNDRGVVAFRATNAAGAEGVYTVGERGVTEVAVAGAAFRAFDGLPVINGAGAVVFRAETTGGGTGIFRHDGSATEVVACTGDRFAELGRFPIVDDTGAVAFCARASGGGEAVYVARNEQLERVVDTGGPFESFRGALIAGGELVVYYGTPGGGAMGIYAGPDPDTGAVLCIGDPLFGSTVAAFVLNPVSVNRAGQIAVRVELNDGRGAIARLLVS